MKNFIWTTKESKKLKLQKIEDNHLLNIYKFLSKQISEIQDLESFAFSPFAPMGEMASDDLDRTLFESMERKSRLGTTQEVIKKEIQKRKLKLPLIRYKDHWKEMTENIEYIKQPAFNGVGRLIKFKD